MFSALTHKYVKSVIGRAFLVLPAFFLLVSSVSGFFGDESNYYIVQQSINASANSSVFENITLNGVLIDDWSDVNKSLWVNVSGVATYDGKTNYKGGISGEQSTPAIMTASGVGSNVLGFADNYHFYIPSVISLNYSSNMTASGNGSIVGGFGYAGAGASSLMLASGRGAFVGGYATSGDREIRGSGDGSFTWGSGGQKNKHAGGVNMGGNNINNGTGKLAGVTLGASNTVEESYGIALGFANNIKNGATFGAFTLGSSNVARGRQCGAIGSQLECDGTLSFTFGIDYDNFEANTLSLGNKNKDLTIYQNNISINKSVFAQRLVYENVFGGFASDNEHVGSVSVLMTSANTYYNLTNLNESLVQVGNTTEFFIDEENGTITFSELGKGFYSINLHMSFMSDKTGVYHCSVFKNGVHTEASFERNLGTINSVGSASAYANVYVSDGDVLYVACDTSSGSNPTLTSEHFIFKVGRLSR